MQRLRHGGIHVSLVAGPRILGRDLDARTEGRMSEQVVNELCLSLDGIDAGDRAHRQAETRVRGNRVRGVRNGTRVKTDHRDRGLGPHAGGDVARTRQLQALDHAGRGTQLLLRPIHVRVIRTAQARDRDIALLVEERGDQHRGNRDGIE